MTGCHPHRPRSSGGSTVELSEEALDAARREAERGGVDVSVVVSEAVQRFVVGTDLGDLLEELGEDDRARPEPLSEAEAMRIAQDELDAFRREAG